MGGPKFSSNYPYVNNSKNIYFDVQYSNCAQMKRNSILIKSYINTNYVKLDLHPQNCNSFITGTAKMC